MPSAHTLSGKPTSVWMDTTPATTYPALTEAVSVDVCVIGGGITGLTAATLLKEGGLTVAVIDMHRVAAGVTGYTTAKVTALHGLTYDQVHSKHGADGARAYAQAQTHALEWIAMRARDVECDFRRRPAFTYAEGSDDIDAVQREVEAAREAGLAAEFTEDVDLPWPVAGAVRLDEQAEFHPRRFLLHLAGTIPGDGSHVFERTRALDVDSGSPCTVRTDRGDIAAGRVLVATHYPFLDRGLFFARLSPERSYALGVRARGATPQGMFLSTESPSHSIRATPHDDGELLIVGGEGHKTGQEGDVAGRYARLEGWARDHFDVESVVYRWGAQDAMPADGIPYVGPVLPGEDRVFTASGFRKWGMTNGVAAARILADRLLGRENAWAETFDSNRFKPVAAAATLLKENVNVGAHFFGDRVTSPGPDALEDLVPGDGAIMRVGSRKVAAYRDQDGTVRAVDPICTHLHCEVRFNSGDRSWDCPCHGSRFDTDGTVLEGPATRDLERIDLGEAAD
jgi:glycine/D-amino acid oxidase-like deaminating enzyme/nitrite reductase/ring-hydroxylating ferredoxin subunit